MEENNPLTLSEFITLLSKESGFSKKDVTEFARAFNFAFEQALAQDDVLKINGLGTFKLVFAHARKSIDVNTGEQINIAEHYRLTFQPDKGLCETVNEPLAHLQTVDLDEQPQNNPLVKLAEQANDLVGILSEIQGYDIKAVNDPKPQKEEPQPQPSREEPIAQQPQNEPVEEEVINQLPENESNEEEEVQDEQEVIDEQPQNEPIAEQPQDEPQQTESQRVEQPQVEQPHPQKPKKKGWLVALFVSLAVVLFLLGVGAGVGYYFYQKSGNQVVERPVVEEVVVEEEEVVVEEEEVVVEEEVEAPIELSLEELVANITPTSPLIATEQIGTYTTLASLALKHYGSRDYWVYIYLANKDILTNPNKTRLGMKVKIPQLDEALLSDEGHNLALRLQQELK